MKKNISYKTRKNEDFSKDIKQYIIDNYYLFISKESIINNLTIEIDGEFVENFSSYLLDSYKKDIEIINFIEDNEDLIDKNCKNSILEVEELLMNELNQINKNTKISKKV